jgi:hypothetical protein
VLSPLGRPSKRSWRVSAGPGGHGALAASLCLAPIENIFGVLVMPCLVSSPPARVTKNSATNEPLV